MEKLRSLINAKEVDVDLRKKLNTPTEKYKPYPLTDNERQKLDLLKEYSDVLADPLG